MKYRGLHLYIGLALLGGLLPILTYWMDHGNLGSAVLEGFQAMTQEQQVAQVAAGLYIKPAYMMLSLTLIILLLGQPETEIITLKWGLVSFLIGEIFCAVNFIVYRHGSIISEYIHSYGMALAFGLFAFALIEGADRYILNINQGRCALGGLCQNCKRGTLQKCAARRILMMVLLMAGILALLPLPIRSTRESYETSLFGYPYSYARFDLYQWYETRALPLAALVFFLFALIPLLWSRGDPIPRLTRVLFSMGIGMLGFSLFRIALSSFFRDTLVWFEFWEELTELMFLTAISFFLWQFREILLEKSTVLRLFLAGKSGT